MLHQRGKVFACVGARDFGHQFWCAKLGHFFDDVFAQQPGGAVIQFGELRRNASLKGEAAQQGGAEAVDGLDPQPARGLNRAGEQLPGFGQRAGGVAGVVAQIGKGAVQVGVGFHRPFTQAAEQPVLHLGRGGFGVSEAQDVLGLDAAQQQAGDAICQHARFAGASVGGKPDGIGGVRGLNLALGSVVAGHSGSPTGSGAARSDISHSPKRDKWS